MNGRPVEDPEFPVRQGVDRVEVDGRELVAAKPLVLMLNKPRGLVTTVRDERGRETVYRCFEGAALPWIAPVGRLDRASEGLLLFTNDPVWAARVTDPLTGPEKTYHVQIDRHVESGLLDRLRQGVVVDGDLLKVASAAVLRLGTKHAWLVVVLEEGKNRHIRRLLEALGCRVLRLIRVAVGRLELGTLAKGEWRRLTEDEVAAL